MTTFQTEVTSRDDDKHRKPVPAVHQWEFDEQERQLAVVGFLLIAGVAAIFLDQRVMPSLNANLLGIALFGLAAATFWLFRFDRRLANALLIAGMLGIVLQAMWWWPTGNADLLLLFPVLLATFLIGWIASLVTGTAALLILVLPALHPPSLTLPGERYPLILLVLTIWGIGYLIQRSHRSLLDTLYGYYLQAHDQLEEARDHRLRLSQATADLTDAYAQLRRMNELLQYSQLEAESARRAKEEFVANVSHELRTPLNMIIGFSETILYSPQTYGGDLPTTLLSDMRVILRNSHHLAQLINDVLDLSQVEAGQLSLSRTWVDPLEVIREAIQAVEPLYRNKGLSLNTELPTAAPQIYCDRLRVRQVLLNLLSNAGRYTTAGGATVRLTADESKFIFSVQDTGPGIPHGEQERIFQPFQQIKGSSMAGAGGSGLGLSISQRLVTLHGGSMWLESEAGKGTTFFFSLPLQPAVSTAGSARRWVHPYTTYEARDRRLAIDLPQPRERVIVLEQQDVLHHQIDVVLGGDADVLRVAELAELEAELAAALPDVLLINNAQAMANTSFSRHLPKLPGRIPIVSCYVPGKQEAWQQLNVADYLVKPVSRQTLLAVTEQLAPEGGLLLVVEDDPGMAQLFRRQLTSAGRGWRVLHTASGAVALRLMGERQPDCVFLDLGLADQDGYDVLQAKNADPQIKPIPVVIVSARDPLGQPVVAGRLRVELPDGLSVRDIVRCTLAVSQAFATAKRPAHPEGPEMPRD